MKKYIKKGIYTNSGPFEKKFEAQCGKFLGEKIDCVSVSNATIGLMLVMIALNNCREKNRVLMPSFTFAATGLAAIWANFEPVFTDIDINTWSMELTDKAKDLIRKKEVNLILFCNPPGMPGDIDPWLKESKKNNVPLIVDSAAGLGSQYPKGEKLKAFAEIFSLHATKTFAVGEGGLIATRNKHLAKKLRALRNLDLTKINT